MEAEGGETRGAERLVSRLVVEIHILVKAIRKGLADGGNDLASAIAYWTFFSIFPLLLGLSAAVGYFFESELAQARLFELVTRALPGSAELVRKNLAAVVAARGTLGLVAVIGLFWSASSAFALSIGLSAPSPGSRSSWRGCGIFC